MRREWLAPLTGVVFLALLIISFAVGGEPPTSEEPVEEIVAFYVDDHDSVIVGAVLLGFAAVSLLFFGGYLRKVLAAAEGEGGVLAAVAMAGATVLAVGAAIDATLSFAMAEAADDIDPAGMQALQALWDNDFIPIAVGVVVLLLASGISIVRHGALPRWLGWVAVVLALLGLTPVGFFAFLGAALWIVVVSVMLSLRARSAGPPPRSGAVSTPTG